MGNWPAKKGFLQVAVSKARRTACLLLRKLVQPVRIRYSPMTYQAESQTAPELVEQQLAVTRVNKLLCEQPNRNFRVGDDTSGSVPTRGGAMDRDKYR